MFYRFLEGEFFGGVDCCGTGAGGTALGGRSFFVVSVGIVYWLHRRCWGRVMESRCWSGRRHVWRGQRRDERRDLRCVGIM